MVDIEVGRARVYFFVGNMAKMGAIGLGVVKCVVSRAKMMSF